METSPKAIGGLFSDPGRSKGIVGGCSKKGVRKSLPMLELLKS